MTEGDLIRLLAVARQPLRLDDLGVAGESDVGATQLIRRPTGLKTSIEELQPNVLLIDMTFPEERGQKAIGQALALSPGARVLALTSDPPEYHAVAKAVRSGAHGFISREAEPTEFAEAIRALHAGGSWLPSDETQAVLSSVGEELEVTAAERRSRLTGIVLGLIPLAGALAAILTLLWRKYLAHVGVRPVDLAIDPASRVIDGVSLALLLVGFFGPLLYVGNLIDLFSSDEGETAHSVRWRKTIHVAISLAWLAVASILDVFADLVLIVMIGPVVVVSLLAATVDLTDQLPAVMRIRGAHPGRIVAGGLAALMLVLTVLSVEVLIAGPDFRTDGVHGILAPRVLGFRAQPMEAFAVDGDRAPRDVLYLGGNADLYVLVDPCDDDIVEFVSVGSTRLVVIDEATCDVASAPES